METSTLIARRMNSLGLNIARLLALILAPALLASIHRGVVSDGALAIVLMQTLLYVLLVLMCFKTDRISYKARFGVFALIGLLVGVGAFFRNQDVGVSYAYSLMATLFLAMMLTRNAALIFVSLVMGATSAASVYMGYYPVERAIGHFFGMCAMSFALIYFVTSMVEASQEQAESEAFLRRERDDALARLSLEEQRRDSVAEAADVAFLTYDYSTGRCYGDATELARHGLPAQAEYWETEKDLSLFPVSSAEALQIQIGELSQKPAGSTANFVVKMHVRPSNELRTFRIAGLNIESEGKLLFYGASIDITSEQVALERAKNQSQQLELMAEAGKVGFFEVDLSAGTMRGNTVLMSRENLSSDSMVSMEKVAQNVPENAREAFQRDVQRAIESGPGQVTTFTHPYTTASGELIHVRVVATTELRGETLIALGASIDISDELQAKSDAETAAQKLLAQQDRQAQMYAVIGHELRTPAASLQMMLEELEVGEKLDARLASANIEQLLSVIDTLRAVAQPERMAEAAYENVQIDELLQQQAATFALMARREGVRIGTDFSRLSFEPVYIQKTLLRQVISNLVKNAIIHSQGTEVRICAEEALVDVGRKCLTLTVEDNGRGVDQKKVDQLFEAYVRGSTEAEGTGLGLHVCREIIQSMGGELSYEANPEGGSRFTIKLEVTKAKDTDTRTNEDRSDDILRGKRVLLAEDNKTIQMLTQKMLTKQGANVVVCDNGSEALNVFETGEFDLVLSDIFMPEKNGYELVAGLRNRGFAGIVIGLTAATIGEETDRMLTAGADAVLSKPINLRALKEQLLRCELVDSTGGADT